MLERNQTVQIKFPKIIYSTNKHTIFSVSGNDNGIINNTNIDNAYFWNIFPDVTYHLVYSSTDYYSSIHRIYYPPIHRNYPSSIHRIYYSSIHRIYYTPIHRNYLSSIHRIYY